MLASTEHSSKGCHALAVCAVQLNSLKRYLKINEMLPLKEAFGSTAVTPKRGQQTPAWSHSWVAATGRSSSSGGSSPFAFARGRAAGAAQPDPVSLGRASAAADAKGGSSLYPSQKAESELQLAKYDQPMLGKHSTAAGPVSRLRCRSAAFW